MRTQMPQMLSYPVERAPRGLVGALSAALFAPVSLFNSLATPRQRSRQWLWAAVLLLIVIGWSTVRRAEWLDAAENAGGDSGAPTALMPGDMGMPGGGVMPGGGMEAGSFDLMPPGGVPVEPGGAPAGSGSFSATLMTGLVAASGVVGMWLAQSLVLMVAPMLRGYPPHWGRALQVAVWASIPLGVMAALRLAYMALGGEVLEGGVGARLLLEAWSGFGALPEFSQRALMALADQLTLFWVWNLALLYVGARYALRGSTAASLLLVTFYVLLAVIAPVLLSGASAA